MWNAALALVAAAALTGLAGLATLIGLLRGNRALTRRGAMATAAVGFAYGSVLLGAGLLSPHREIEMGEEKHICEIDCHLAYALTGVETPAPNLVVVKLRVRFDPATVSSRRGNQALRPGARTVRLLDESGRVYLPASVTGLGAALRPGETAAAQIRFELPAGARASHLRLEDADPAKRLLIGSETSPFHKRIVFRLS